MKEADGIDKITLRPRASESVTLSIPIDTLEAIRRAALRRDMSAEALMKLYIGQGLRQEAPRPYSGGMQECGAEVMTHSAPSEE